MKIADTIVYRHACECVNANQAPGDAGVEHRFDVDGQPFPWLLTEDGATFTRLADDLYLCHIHIVLVRQADMAWLTFSHENQDPAPMLGDTPFPWWISEDGFTYRASKKTIPTLELSFLAVSVDTDGEIHDE